MQLQHIYNELKDKNEIAIVKKYDCISTRYTITLTSKIIFIDFECNYIGKIILNTIFKKSI